MCTDERRHGLTREGVATELRGQLLACEADGHWRIRAAVIMPDHVHLLVKLTGALPLGRVVARVKAKTRGTLLATGADPAGSSLRWQGNYYEHRLRPDDSVEDVLRYVFLNPYRAGLVARTETYRWFWMHVDESSWFRPVLNERERPFAEWLR